MRLSLPRAVVSALGTAGSRLRAGLAPLRTVTALGWGVLVAGLVSWVVSVRTGWTEFSLMAAAAGTLLVLAAFFTIGRAIVRVEFHLDPQRVTVGAPAAGQVRVSNAAHGRLFPIRLELPVGAATALFDLPSLPRGGSHEELFVVPTHRRAVIEVGPATTVRGDPLGLLRRSVEWTATSELYVHPRISLLESLGAGFLRDLEGQSTNEMSMTDLAFHTLRDYVPGDDRRYVHWRSSARTGKLLVRQFVDTRRSHVAVTIDSRPAAYRGEDDYELAISVGGSIAVRALRDEQDATVVAGRTVIGGRTARITLDELSRLAPEDVDLSAQVRTLSNAARDASIAVLVTGPTTPFPAVRRAAAVFDTQVRTLVCVVDSVATAAITRTDDVTVLTVSSLRDLAGLIRVAAR